MSRLQPFRTCLVSHACGGDGDDVHASFAPVEGRPGPISCLGHLHRPRRRLHSG